jgi:hypothetical protein
LFNNDDDEDNNNNRSNQPSHHVNVDAYPICFLRSAGNIQASGVPNCFLPLLANINQSIRNNLNNHPHHIHNNLDSDDDSDMDNQEPIPPLQGGQQVLKPVASQFYNYIAHRTATRAGKHLAAQGTVTAAIAGAFAQTTKDRTKANDLLDYCDTALPSDRFKTLIDIRDCPSSCRAELVYSVDVRALRHPTGRSVCHNSSLIIPSLIRFLDSSSIISSPPSQTLGTMMPS